MTNNTITAGIRGAGRKHQGTLWELGLDIER